MVGCVAIRKHVDVSVNNCKYKSHRLAWFYVHGRWPVNIDHIDGNPQNNRFANLREASQSENMQNQRHARKDNKSGALGVSCRGGAKFTAAIKASGKRIYLGTFETKDAAHQEYLRAKAIYHEFGTLDKPSGGLRGARVKSSQYKGVTLVKNSNPIKWRSQINIKGVIKKIGVFDCEIAAYQAFLSAKYHSKNV